MDHLTFWDFANDNPLTTAFAVVALVYIIAVTLFRGWNRLMRTINVHNAGWPPAHLDADGDWKETP
jgi:hypothetical protein